MNAEEPVVEVTLLGGFGVALDGVPVDINIGITSGIVARLALTPGVTVPADELVADLWDEPTPGAVNTIRSQVSRLRAGVMGELIRGGRGGYALDVPRVSVDHARLHDLIAEGSLAEAEQLWSRMLLPRLDRFPFVERARAELAEASRAASLRLGQERLERGDFDHAVAALGPVVEASPLHEKPVLLLATALSKAGRPSEALAAIDSYRRRLRDSEGLDLPRESDRLRASIVRRDSELVASDVERHGVAVALTQLIGREEELESIEAARLEARVVTLVGPGGVGKTRLAMESARRSVRAGDEVQWVIELADLLGDDILGAVADVLGSSDGTIETVARQLSSRRTLLILDNAEHLLVPVAEFVTEILGRCPGLAIVVTSREALHLPGERVVAIQPWDDKAMHDAVALFTDRVRDVRPGFEPSASDLPVIRRICARVDGLPLGIELVASLADVLDLAELEASVARGLESIESRNALPRHRSLTSVIDWSVSLLGEDERAVLAQLALFAGSFSLDTVAGICISAVDPRRITAVLAQKSLVAVAVAADGARRYRVLESVRQYCATLLDDDQKARFLERHAHWHADALDSLRDALRGPSETSLQLALEAGRPDFHLALDTAILGGDRTLALRLTGGLAWHWFRRNSMSDGRLWMTRALSMPGGADPTVEAWAYIGATMFAFQRSDREATTAYLAAGIAAAEASDDTTAQLIIRGYERYIDSLFAPQKLPGYTDFVLPDISEQPAWVQGELLSMHGQLLRALGRPAQALEVLAESRRVCADAGYLWCLGSTYFISGKILIDLRKGKEAARSARLGILVAQRGPSVTSALSQLEIAASASAYLERHRDGAALFGAVTQIGRQFGVEIAEVDGQDAERIRRPVKHGLTTAEWDENYERGRRLSYAKAIELALSLSPAEP